MRYGGVSEGVHESLNGKRDGIDSGSNVTENRSRAFKALFPGSDPGNRVVFIGGVFKTNILQAAEPGGFDNYDAAISTDNNLVLAQATADCASVIISDTNHKVVALVHGSWHTLKDQIISKTIAQLKETERVGELAAGIGPMVCPKCYEFGPEAKNLFDGKYLAPKGKKYLVNTRQMVLDQLQAGGVKQVDDLNICTIEDERFFSARRLGQESGRFLTLASL